MKVHAQAEPGAPARSVAWLARDVLLAVVDLESIDSDHASVAVTVDGSPTSVAARRELISQAAHAHGERAIFTIAIDLPATDSKPIELTFGSGSSSTKVGLAPASVLGVELRTLAREHLAGLDRETRSRLTTFLIGSAESSNVDSITLSESLALLRDALRDPHPRIGSRSDEPRSVGIDDLVRVDDRSFFVRGWIRDERAPIVRLTAVSPEGARVELFDRLARVRRADLDQLFASANGSGYLGFVSSIPLEVPSRLGSGWILELENAAGVAAEAEMPEPIEDPVAARDTIVATLEDERSPTSPATEHVFPTVARLQERLASLVEIEHVERFGEEPRSAEVSIVVPLYKRVDLVQHQLASFARDPEIAEADLIYVLDSPELADALLAEGRRLFDLYRVPFRIATLSRNGGFAVANNRGASLTNGRHLLLLNSDVLPATSGWLGQLARLHDETPRIGALGPKLLFEDQSLQHAGLYFRHSPALGAWENAHYFKGLHRDLPAANVPRPVPAVTAACLMIAPDLYRELDGLRSIYIQGDYEDSDLCLRIAQAGYENWYRPEVTLYHLEGRSYATAARQANARYNAWLHSSLWGPRIEQLMSEHDPGRVIGLAVP